MKTAVTMKDVFLRLGVLGAILLFCVACLAAFGYGLYWLWCFLRPTILKLDLGLYDDRLFWGIFLILFLIFVPLKRFYRFFKGKRLFNCHY